MKARSANEFYKNLGYYIEHATRVCGRTAYALPRCRIDRDSGRRIGQP
ncbi:hypothetical protein [Rhodococcus sp. 1163]|nr:hypothetical protein [Rhodococcus sp. 1163]